LIRRNLSECITGVFRRGGCFDPWDLRRSIRRRLTDPNGVALCFQAAGHHAVECRAGGGWRCDFRRTLCKGETVHQGYAREPVRRHHRGGCTGGGCTDAEYHARPEVEPMPAIYCIAGCNNIDAAAALAYLLRLEGTGAKPPSAFCRCAALRCFISETLRGSGAGFCVPNQHECARTGSLSRAAHFDGARRTWKFWSACGDCHRKGSPPRKRRLAARSISSRAYALPLPRCPLFSAD